MNKSLKFRTSKIRTSKIGSSKIRTSKIRTSKIGTHNISKKSSCPTTFKGCNTNYKNPRKNYKIGDFLTKGGSKYIYKIKNVKNMLYVEIDVYKYKKVKEIFEEFCLYVLLERQNILVNAYDWKYEKVRHNHWICSFYIELCDLNLVSDKGDCSSSEENMLLKQINETNINQFMDKIRHLNIIELPEEHEVYKYCSFLKPGKTYYNVDYKPENICIFNSGDNSWDIKLLDVGIEYLHEIPKDKIEEILTFSFVIFFSKMLKWCNNFVDKKKIIINAEKKLGYITAKNIDKMIFSLDNHKYKNNQTPINTFFWYLCLENRTFKEKCKTKKELRDYILRLFSN